MEVGYLGIWGGPRSVVVVKIPARKWSSLFGIKSSGRSSFPLVKNVYIANKGSFILEIPDQIIDINISRMDHTLVGRFLGARPNIEIVRAFVKRK